MQTQFSARQLEDAATASSEAVIRKCVHCGFCLATCPTYLLLGDELDSPRGRIYLIKDMLENDRMPTAKWSSTSIAASPVSSCMTTCPSGVHYMHLVDHARAYIERRFTRPFASGGAGTARLRAAVSRPYAPRILLAQDDQPAQRHCPRIPALKPLAAMLQTDARAPGRAGGRGSLQSDAACAGPRRHPAGLRGAGTEAGDSRRDGAVAQPLGLRRDLCTRRRLLWCARASPRQGAGRLMAARAMSMPGRRNWMSGLDAIVVTASGCGTMIKDYGFLLRGDAAHAARAARVSSLARRRQ